MKSRVDAPLEIVVVVPHERVRAIEWAERAGERIPVLADGGFQASVTYGVAFQSRIHGDTSNTPATFVIDGAGVLRWALIGGGARNFADRPSTDAVAAAVAEARESRAVDSK